MRRSFPAFLLCAMLPAAVAAQERIPSHCVAIAQGPERLYRAAWSDPVPADTVRLHFINHAMFLIRTANVSAVTDFAGHTGSAPFVPDVVTMNNAHSTHFTSAPDPAIAHVLRGWAPDGGPADHHLDLGEMLVRNVPTATRDFMGGVREFGNSIFIFEAGGLCIGHLGHLHHEPTPMQYAMLGRVDVVLAPVDGGATLSRPVLIDVLQRLRSSLVIPMHWNNYGTLDRFLVEMSGDFEISRPGVNEIEVSLFSLPSRPTVMVLEPAWLR